MRLRSIVVIFLALLLAVPLPTRNFVAAQQTEYKYFYQDAEQQMSSISRRKQSLNFDDVTEVLNSQSCYFHQEIKQVMKDREPDVDKCERAIYDLSSLGFGTAVAYAIRNTDGSELQLTNSDGAESFVFVTEGQIRMSLHRLGMLYIDASDPSQVGIKSLASQNGHSYVVGGGYVNSTNNSECATKCQNCWDPCVKEQQGAMRGEAWVGTGAYVLGTGACIAKTMLLGSLGCLAVGTVTYHIAYRASLNKFNQGIGFCRRGCTTLPLHGLTCECIFVPKKQ